MTQLDPIFVNELQNIDKILKNEIIKNILDGTGRIIKQITI